MDFEIGIDKLEKAMAMRRYNQIRKVTAFFRFTENLLVLWKKGETNSDEAYSDGRPLTFLKYNREGDLLFSCAKDHTPNAWFADNGERLGTYKGHNGAVWCCDVSKSSESVLTIKAPGGRLRINRAVWGPLNRTIISAGEDAVVRIWDSETGKPLKESEKEWSSESRYILVKILRLVTFYHGFIG